MRKIIIVFYILFSLSCSKEEDNNNINQDYGSVTFYTTSTYNWSLIVDGKEYGQIEYATQMPVCGDTDFQNLSLKTGSHTVDAKSLDGYAWGDPKTIYVISGKCIQVKLPK